MDDPWDVKSVRQTGQYVSCMKINGVPLLPPLLSKDCRKEMQYYKMLAKEVEQRIKTLKSMMKIEKNNDITEVTKDDTNVETSNRSCKCYSPLTHSSSDTDEISTNGRGSTTSIPQDSSDISKEIVIELEVEEKSHKEEKKSDLLEQPVRDNDDSKKRTAFNNDQNSIKSPDTRKNLESISFSIDINNEIFDQYFAAGLHFSDNDPSTLMNSKSFTGSLLDIHSDNSKSSQCGSTLTRQSSYTLLKPSPQLMAHLKVEAGRAGVDIMSISMSDSLSYLSLSPSKKRRSWDLEAAKNKWSNMALELNKKNPTNAKTLSKIVKSSIAPSQSKSIASEKPKRSNVISKPRTISEPIKQIPKKLSPYQNGSNSAKKAPIKDQFTSMCNDDSKKVTTPKNGSQKLTPSKTGNESHKTLISDSEDPASKVRELYNKIKNQQQRQIANLVEKQKREQMLLKQVFEEQNNLLYNQIKSVCPKSPIEIRQAWGEADQAGPVSLSQLINTTSVCCDPCAPSITTCIDQCDDILKKSRDITNSLKNAKTLSKNEVITPSSILDSKSRSPRSPTRRSPLGRSTVSPPTRRRINYDAFSTEQDCEPILTDRTNDTLADVNVTIPTDCEEVYETACDQMLLRDRSPEPVQLVTIEPKNNLCRPLDKAFTCTPSLEERAAASKIVAYAKGYLVRRLLRTERVQATVQTIKDVLLCALQLHQDREGIRGADVDLHRRLIQQITAACYSLHDTFVTSSPSERCAMIAADRARRLAAVARTTPPPHPRVHRSTDMSKSHSGVFISRVCRTSSPSAMTHSSYETCDKMRDLKRRRWR